MKAMRLPICLSVSLSVVFSGCVDRPSEAEIYAKRLQYEQRYACAKVEEAGQALREYLEYLLDLKEMDIDTVDYGYLLGLTYGRLFAISEFQGAEEEAEFCFAQSVYWYHQEVVNGRPERPAFTRESLRHKMKVVDAFEKVRWRAEVAADLE